MKKIVAGNNDPDYLNNLIKINEMNDRFVVDFAILLMNPNFINSQYKKFDLELLQNVDRKSCFCHFVQTYENEKSLNSSHHKKDAVIIIMRCKKKLHVNGYCERQPMRLVLIVMIMIMTWNIFRN
ncbi:MAG: hypothetical protein V8Q71_00840 [Bacilli bacterium]